MAGFSHLDEGTSEEIWRADGRIDAAPPLDVDVDALIVVAAHPDDETLGAGGLIHRTHARGAAVTIVFVTDGEASHPLSSSRSPDDLRFLRRDEAAAAVRDLAPDAQVHFLALPDGGIREHTASLDDALTAILDSLSAPADRTLIVAPWSGDRHRDHRVTAERVSQSVAGRGIRHLGYPIWLWHWGTPTDVPWESGVALPLSPADREAKGRALRRHASQIEPLSDAPGDEAILPASMQAHFARDLEFFLVEPHGPTESLPTRWFDDFYARHEDPWGFETRWYEERKRALLMASLPSRELGNVLEIGCATGLITKELARRATHVLALDASAAALAAASARVGDDPAVTFRRIAVPRKWPPGTFDTIVLSEVGYYLSTRDLDRTIGLTETALAEGGSLVACHWRHPVAEYPLSGDDVHRALRSAGAWETLALHEEEDFLLEVFCRRPVVSVARREGLL